jgi:hypothetical protein
MDLVAEELERVHERIAGRFARAEPRARVQVRIRASRGPGAE